MKRFYLRGGGKYDAARELALGWRIQNRAGRADIDLYDVIGEDMWGDGTSASDFVSELRSLDVDTIDLHINSPGGFVDDALAMYHALQQHRANVTAHIEGMAASAASVVAMAADNILIAPHARMMIHDAMTGVGILAPVNARGIEDLIGQLASIRDVLNKESENIASIYAERAGNGTTAEWRERMQQNGELGTTYRGQEAVDIGLADGIDEAPTRNRARNDAAGRQLGAQMTASLQAELTERAALRRTQAEREIAALMEASAEGTRLGKQHQGDTTRLVHSLGATVDYRPLSEMQDPSRPDFVRSGMTFLPFKAITVASDFDCDGERMTPNRSDLIIAHECAHLLNIDSVRGLLAESHCDVFAEAFLKQAPEDPVMARYRANQELEEGRARARQIAGTR